MAVPVRNVDHYYAMCLPPGFVASAGALPTIQPATPCDAKPARQKRVSKAPVKRRQGVRSKANAGDGNAVKRQRTKRTKAAAAAAATAEQMHMFPSSAATASTPPATQTDPQEPKGPVKDDGNDDTVWSVDVLNLKCKELNKYIIAKGLSQAQAERLKSAKRRFHNKASAKRNRMKKRLARDNAAAAAAPTAPTAVAPTAPVASEARSAPAGHTLLVTTPHASGPSFAHLGYPAFSAAFPTINASMFAPYQVEGEWEEEESLMESTSTGGGSMGVAVPMVGQSLFSTALDVVDEGTRDTLQLSSPRFFGDMVQAVMASFPLMA